ncbi:MAG: prolyl oligopeptidase family serine peptidase [Mariniblastus sp.]
MHRIAIPILLFAVSFLVPQFATQFEKTATAQMAQEELEKRPLEHKDYDRWNTLTDQRLSNDGKWILYSIRSGKVGADSILNIRRNGSTKEYSITRAAGARFTFDSQFVIYRVMPDKAKIKALQKAKAKPEQMPSVVLEVLELETGEKFSASRVNSFQIPRKGNGWVAYRFDKPLEPTTVKSGSSSVVESYEVTPEGLRRPEKKPKLKKRPIEEESKNEVAEKTEKTKTETAKTKTAKTESGDSKPKIEAVKKTKTAGTTLVLRNLESGLQQTYPDVVRYTFSNDGERLAFVASVDSNNKKKPTTQAKNAKGKKAPAEPADGVYVVELDDLELHQIASGPGEYKNLAFSDDGSQLAFFTNKDDYKVKTSSWSLYHWKTRQKTAAKIADEKSDGIPKDWWVSPSATAQFTEDGKRLFFDTAPIPEDVMKERKHAALKAAGKKIPDEDDEAKAKLDLWHWQDPLLQPQQLLQAARERGRSYRAVFNIRAKKIVQIATKEIPSVRIDYRSHSNVVAASSNMPYRKMLSWDVPGFQDMYLINLDTGNVETLIEKTKSSGSISPEGKFITWFDAEERKWYAISTGTNRKPVEISKGIEHPLQNELHDTPSLPRAYGSAGWMQDDEAFLIYDRFDIWKLDPTGKKKPVCLTEDQGRENSMRFRYLRLDFEQRAIDPAQPLILSAFDETTKASGFYRLNLPQVDSKKRKSSKSSKVAAKETKKPDTLERLIMLDERLSRLTKARNTDDVIFNRSTFEHCPDAWSSKLSFKKIHRVSDMNPQQDEYSWGKAELVHWDATDGQKLDGLLIKPDGFDPDKKYPLMVYFYERNSDNLHSYYTPAAGRSIINHSFYVSRGYVIFIPDIPYKTGEPGPSAANAILPGVKSIVDMGFINEAKIGMQGHSWGGYQTAYLVTQTDMFACAESGAPVSNMTSAYGGIRWSSGMSRMFQYERTQSRIGEDLWAAREKYIANSPVFFADKVNTPLLILHNDEDGAVPWYQGIELFVALRRLEKKAWLLNYNGQPHWVMKDENRLDFAIRMQQFFDHYLMDAPEPEWMAYGVPAVDKGKKFGLDLLEPESKSKKETPESNKPAKETADSN